MEFLQEHGIIQVYLFRGDLRCRRHVQCDQIPLTFFPTQVLELGHDTALLVYRSEESAAVGADLDRLQQAVEEGGPLIQVRPLQSPLRPDMLGLNECAKWLSFEIYPSALDWSSVGRPPTPIVRLKAEACRSLRYAIAVSGVPSCSINFGDWYLDGGLQALPRLPSTLKELEIEGLRGIFSRPALPTTVPQSSTSYLWAQDLCTKFSFLQRLKLTNCHCSPPDIANLREWLPNVSIVEIRRGLPTTFTGLQSEWVYQKGPVVSAELISRSALLQHPDLSHIIVNSLKTIIGWYLRGHRYEYCLRVLPWAALAAKHKKGDLVARVETYFAQFANEQQQLLQCLSWLTDCHSDSLCRLLAYWARLPRRRILTLGSHVLREFEQA
ncbi:hypothetical protein EYZ11_012248 [Aspergillus tanneri]|uniref:Uncharacterized protein n=1 Tax=Aspergillus tanneri TaxID=1220188 RepID=A0A4S3J2U4_9EURO|nr:uncharacterized protein ATNIH1004_011759 [Aspergillus tanneri]KAA8641623.1 hypothetical protein ATNIH1004_011759 [Aspergillus tanneri]THC88307.1 hypothetical protein EYZ11_012248 [Aspergillus tanneri]